MEIKAQTTLSQPPANQLTYLHPLSGSNQSVLLSVPAAEHDGPTRTPV